MKIKLNLKDINWKKLSLMLMGFALVFAAFSYSSYRLLSDRFTLEVPNFVGRDIAEVQGMVRNLALIVNVTAEEFDREIPRGYVIEQSLDAGSMVRGQSSVDLVLSKGPEVRLIPLVTAMELREALKLLEDKQLEVEKSIMVHTAAVEEGKVLAQSPAPDEWTGEAVTLVVSAGPQPVVLYTPYFLGMGKMDAVMLARDLGLSVRLSELDNTELISYQSPEPGAEIKRGDVLMLRIGG